MEDFDNDEPIALHARAMENLTFIRDAIERSTPFTGVSGKGMVAMGTIALAGGWLARLHLGHGWWIKCWVAIAFAGCAAGLLSMYWKLRALDQPSVSRAAARFALNVAPAVLAGVFLTKMFHELGLLGFLPGMWLLLYGAGVVAGGAHSVRVLPIMGGVMMALGGGALVWTLYGAETFSKPDAVGEWALGAGFGGLHIIAGIIVIRRYGG